MKKIESYNKLREEKRLSKQKVARLALLIEEDVTEIKNSLNPAKAAGKAVKNLISSEKNGVMTETIDVIINALINKLLLRKSNWLFKLAIAFLLKNYAKNLFLRNTDNIIDWIISKLRTSENHHSQHYRDETAAELDWDI